MSYTNGLDKPTDYFNTKLFVGSGSTQSITGVGFQPDWVWIKQRNTSRFHYLFDSIRGATKKLHSNSTDAESTLSTTLSSFDSDGYTVETDAGVNQSSGTYASWNWLAGGTGSSNTDGSITSNVSANTTSGFSIVSYTGTGANATIGHGLSSEAKMVIVKERSGADAWIVGHSSIGFTKNLLLNLTNAEFADSTIWNNTSPTSSVFSVGSSASTNQSSATYIAYCFAEKKGFSKIGSYTGNGSTNGTFVYTGFKPAWVMIKKYDNTSSAHWMIKDSTRDPTNVNTNYLNANLSNADATGVLTDFLSNGFKQRSTNDINNDSGQKYIYIAFAESPFTTSTGIPTTAR